MPLLKKQPMQAQQKENLRSSYQSYNTYRGDMEQSRQRAGNERDQNLLNNRATMTGNGVKSGGSEWNRTLANVESQYDSKMNDINKGFDDYKNGAEFKALYTDYQDRIQKDSEQVQSYNQKMLAREMQGSTVTPTFDEFVDLEFGDEQKQAAAKTDMNMRRNNERASQ